jgi:phage terminase large subunit GpA-like protein
MIIDARALLRAHAQRLIEPRPLPDIVDFLEGRCRDRDGAIIPPLQLIDKDDPYRGPFTTENCPDIREILRSCVSRTTRRTVIVGPTQSFKTTIIIGVEAYTIAVDHGPIGHVLPNETPLARAFSAKRFQPIVDNTPWLRALKPANPDLYKTLELGFTTCTLRFAGANSPGNLASWPYRRVIGDETDKFPQLIKNESGTRELLLQRTGQFAHWNGIDASTPTVPWGTIWQAALVGTCERYHVPCPHCHRPFAFRFSTDGSTLVWDQTARHANGTWDLERVARTVHYRCPHCGNEIWENHRRDMLHAAAESGAHRHGLGWIPDPKETADNARADYGLVADPDCRSFFRSCFNVLHPNRTFAAIARKFLLAGRDRSKLQNFWNSELGEVFESGTTAVPDWKVLADRAEDYRGDPPVPTDPVALAEQTPRILATPPTDLLPEGVLVLTAASDKQENPPRLEYEIVGWGEDHESWGIEYGAIMCAGGDWAAARAELNRRFDRIWRMPLPDSELTLPLTVAAEAHDSGHLPDEVYRHVADRHRSGKRAFAIKGSPEGYGQPLVERPRKSGVRKVELWMVGTVTGKAELYANLRNTEPGTTGYMHFPRHLRRGYDQEWFRQIRAERCEIRVIGGRQQMRFHKPSGARNEALDIRIYARVALALLNPAFAKLREKAGLPAKLSDATSQSELPLAGTQTHEPTGAPSPDAADHHERGDGPRSAAPDPGPPPGGAARVFDPATGRIHAEPVIEKPAPPAPPKPNTYERVTGPAPTTQPRPARVRPPLRRPWATTW